LPGLAYIVVENEADLIDIERLARINVHDAKRDDLEPHLHDEAPHATTWPAAHVTAEHGTGGRIASLEMRRRMALPTADGSSLACPSALTPERS
jgi:hypothetical protein